MRMKVDSNEYPTLSHFKRDLEQIVCNAQWYNPLTVKDQRGRAIVHAAHGMVRQKQQQSSTSQQYRVSIRSIKISP